MLTKIISTTDVPLTTYVAHPKTPLHYVDARLQLLCQIAFIVLIPRLPWEARLGLVTLIALLAITCLPRRLYKEQIKRILLITFLTAGFTALFMSQVRLSSLQCIRQILHALVLFMKFSFTAIFLYAHTVDQTYVP
jgi:hypothetical protein